MRRFAPLLLVCSLVLSAVAVGGDVAAASAPDPAASDLPSGFTDGVPVGSGDAPPTTVPGEAPAGADVGDAAGKANNAPVTKYFGQGPWEAIKAATEATTRCAGLSAPGLTALVVSPIFKESSAATLPTSAPSPMTLSRYDEWNGVMATTTNVSANYGLYAFRDPYTAYTRAYWHPGIGIFQYDSAGVGAPYTAIERMDVRTVAADVARGMAARYCAPPVNIVGHAAPFTEQERRDAAWWPWWAGTTTRGCPLCQIEFDRMTGEDPYFSNISLVPGITATGGAVRRSCTLGGQTYECWYINPSVGVIQGATALGHRRSRWQRQPHHQAGPALQAVLRPQAQRERGAALAPGRHRLQRRHLRGAPDRQERPTPVEPAGIGPRVGQDLRAVRRHGEARRVWWELHEPAPDRAAPHHQPAPVPASRCGSAGPAFGRAGLQAVGVGCVPADRLRCQRRRPGRRALVRPRPGW